MDFKIEPIDENGILDYDFYSSKECDSALEIVKTYLSLEGFNSLNMEREFTITINKRSWRCKPNTYKKNK
jgi:hypothetical protein